MTPTPTPPSTAHYVSFMSSSAEQLLHEQEEGEEGGSRGGVDRYTGTGGGEYPVCADTSLSYLPNHSNSINNRNHSNHNNRGGMVGAAVRRLFVGGGGGGRTGKRAESIKSAWAMLVALVLLAGVFAVTLLLFVSYREGGMDPTLLSSTTGMMREQNRSPSWRDALPKGMSADEEIQMMVKANRNGGSGGGGVGGDVSVWGASSLVRSVEGLRSPLIWMWEEKDFQEEFGLFVNTFARDYATEESRYRYEIFKKNVYFIHSHNSQDTSYKVRMNQFGDLTFDEFRSSYLGLKPKSRRSSLGFDLSLADVAVDDLPKSHDWQQKGCVSEVKDQKQCGSCWAFSTTGALEGASCAQGGGGKLLDLSEQQLVDCGRAEGNMGCGGGEMDDAFQYVIDNKGICAEKDYPYTATENTCKAKRCTSVLEIKGFKDVPVNNETAMKAALTKYGPLSVGIEADQPGFQFYSHGVFSGKCGNSLDHGVLLVGYGKDEKMEMDFWRIKNSWGPHWGDHGFMRMAQHKANGGECGITETPSFPIIGAPAG
eukprot:GHVS01026016.1.p1 GENE.GHVS01026016.1~~GHVS01026016.1.p1  ORF type:complete len:539 (-),score=115.73 GHVS01026016.1:1078-2694(-)